MKPGSAAAAGFAASVTVALGAGLVYCLHVARRLVGARRREVARAFVPGALAGGLVLALSLVAREACARFGLGDAVLVVRRGEGTFVRDVMAPSLTEPLKELMERHRGSVYDIVELRLPERLVQPLLVQLRAGLVEEHVDRKSVV